MDEKNKNIIIEFSPIFFDIIIGGKIPDPRYVISPNSRIPSKGWKALSPKLKSERKLLLDKCGSSCFLSPNTLSYPICSKNMDCLHHCSGILSAKIRASQWKNYDVLDKADNLFKNHCLQK